jgi:hypothetical protein
VGCLAVRTPIGRTIIAWKGVSEENACNNLSRYLNSRSSLAAAPFEPAAHLEICQDPVQRRRKVAPTNYENLT